MKLHLHPRTNQVSTSYPSNPICLIVAIFGKMSFANLEQNSEEFTNFMHKVTQVADIVEKLASKDKHLQEIGDLEAKAFLRETDLDTEHPDLQVTSDRTVINRKALFKQDNPDTQSQEAFMAEVAKDADRRSKERKRRKERMETYKKYATMAYRSGEYEKALTLYGKAIELIKDNWLLYTNRAVTYVNLKLYDKAIADCLTALQLHENSLRARLVLAKAYLLNGDAVKYEATIEAAKKINGDQITLIEGFVNTLAGGPNS